MIAFFVIFWNAKNLCKKNIYVCAWKYQNEKLSLKSKTLLYEKIYPPSIIFIICMLMAFISCQKLNMQNSPFGINTSLLSLKQNSDIYANASFTPHDEDSVETMTVLGAQLPNPYLIPNMRKAYLDLGYDPNRAVVNDLYIRFLPNLSQLALLDSVMNNQGYELFDTPMDYEVISE